MLYATGLIEEDMAKPQVGISSVWFEGNPCNKHLLDLSSLVRDSVARAGLVPMRFNSIGVSDGISMGTNGMRFSLQSREIIADGIETVMNAQWYDANVSLPGCDKNMPGVMMAMGRVNRPSIMLYGGSIKPGAVREASRWIRSVLFRRTGSIWRGRLMRRSGLILFAMRVLVLVLVVACTRLICWRRPSRPWA